MTITESTTDKPITEQPIRPPDRDCFYVFAAFRPVTGLTEHASRHRYATGGDLPKIVKGPGGRLGAWGDDIAEWQRIDHGPAHVPTPCSICGKSFSGARGVGVHRRRQ